MVYKNNLHSLFIKLYPDLPRDCLKRSNGVADNIQLLVLRVQHPLLNRRVLREETIVIATGAIGLILQLGVLRGGVPRGHAARAVREPQAFLASVHVHLVFHILPMEQNRYAMSKHSQT